MSYSHAHGAEASNPRLGLAIALTLAFVVGEATAGYLAHRPKTSEAVTRCHLSAARSAH